MLDAYAKQPLFRALSSNRATLFVGAGFSHDATNRLGDPLPLAAALAAKIWAWAGFTGSYDDDSELPVVYQAALTSGRKLSGLRTLLEDNLLAVHIPQWYDTVTRLFWYRVYGTNIDNVLEEAYKRARPEMSLEPLSAITAEFRERDQYLTRLQYVKLHGSLPCDPHEVTFGTLQFAGRANALDDWWRQFVRDYVHQPTLFVGSDINEPLFWQAIAARGERGSNPEERPQSYLVVPSLSEARRRLLEAYNITHVPATAQDFFAWLAAEYLFPSRESVLSVILPESSELLRNYSNRPTIERALKQLLTVFQRVPEPGQVSSRSKAFLLGAPPDWDDIRAGLDAPREINSYLKTEIEKALAQSQRMQTFALLGEGGSGKSTIARRVAVTLRQEGYEVFYSDGSERVRPHELVQALRTVKSKVLLVVDNAALLGPTIVELIKACLELDIPPILLLASRYIPFEQRLRSYLESDQYREVDVPILSDPDIGNVPSVVEKQAAPHGCGFTPRRMFWSFSRAGHA